MINVAWQKAAENGRQGMGSLAEAPAWQSLTVEKEKRRRAGRMSVSVSQDNIAVSSWKLLLDFCHRDLCLHLLQKHIKGVNKYHETQV